MSKLALCVLSQPQCTDIGTGGEDGGSEGGAGSGFDGGSEGGSEGGAAGEGQEASQMQTPGSPGRPKSSTQLPVAAPPWELKAPAPATWQ